MTTLRWLSALLFALAVVAGGAWLLQWQSGAQLRDEIALLRDENRQIAQLRAENAKLVAAQPPVAELERLQADRTAVVQLRAEIEKLKAGVDERERALNSPAAIAKPTAESTALPMVPANSWKNAGRATPSAAVETVMWAASHGEVDLLASMLSFEPEIRRSVDNFFAAIPESMRAQYGTVERLVAQSMAKDVPLAMRVDTEKLGGSDRAEVVVRLQNKDGATQAPLALRRGDEGWRLAVPPDAVQAIANEIGVQIAATRKGG
jgi:hypothetical protein